MNQVTRLDNGTIELIFSIPWSDIQAAREKEIVKEVEETEISGFRKGKAPRDIVEPKLDTNKLLTAALQSLLPTAYQAIANAHKPKPVLYPHIKITKGQPNEDWEFIATTCEAPQVKLPPDYKSAIKNLEIKNANQKLTAIVDYLRQHSTLQIPHLLIEEESNHRLGHLAENLAQLSLDLPRYLQSKKMTTEDLRAQTASQAKIDLEIEFILETVRNGEQLPDRKKTLDFLASLV